MASRKWRRYFETRDPLAPPPFCVIAKLAFGRYLRTMKVPEEWIPHVTAHGWMVIIRDSDLKDDR